MDRELYINELSTQHLPEYQNFLEQVTNETSNSYSWLNQ